MKNNSSEPGTIITFYSYKGGTGRSMAVANIGCLMANNLSKESSKRVLITDWDLESPGLHNYFSKQLINKNRKKIQYGIIDYFVSLKNILKKKPNLYKQINGEKGWQLLNKELPVEDYIISDVIPKLDFIPAGYFDANYANLVNSFNWMEFFNKYGETIRIFRELLSSIYNYVLVDSRTGVTDISGICTMLLPEKLIWVFTANNQSIYSVTKLIKQAIEYRRSSNDFRPLAVFPLPCRIDDAEYELKEKWLNKYKTEFEISFKDSYDVKDCNLTDYFKEVKIPYKSYFAYDEKIAVLEEPDESLSLHRAYRYFFDRLINLDYAWQIDKGKYKFKKNNKVFISYAREDVKIAQKICQDLKAEGIEPWLDIEQTLPGQDWTDAISRAIQESSFFLLLYSSNSASKKGYVQKEAKIAIKLFSELPPDEIFIIPIRLDNIELPEKFENLQWVDLFTSYKHGLNEILRVLKNKKNK